MHAFLQELKTQRWDDHRFYHHSRINQTLHFISAISFLFAYALLFKDPAGAALVGWLVGMVTRQSGHFFFEPKDYDEVNQATHEHKEAIKVGYNLRRKVVLHAIWGAVPLLLLFVPALFGVFQPHANVPEYIRHVAQVWLVLGVAALIFRTIHLFFIRDVQTGLAWLTKIITDPFNDAIQYRKAPLALLKGEFFDPGHGKKHHA